MINFLNISVDYIRNLKIKEIGLKYKLSKYEMDRLRTVFTNNKIEFKHEVRIDYSVLDFKNKTIREISEETGILYNSLKSYCYNNDIEFKHNKPGPKKNT